MLRLIVSMVFLITSGPALAQDISIKFSEIPAGSWFLMNDAGRQAMHVFRGKKGRYYVYDVVPGTDPNGPREFRDFRDASGNNTRREFADGRVVKYAPHNCLRVIGQCAFTESGKGNAGKPYKTKMVRVNTPTGKGFTFTQVAIATSGEQIRIRWGKVFGLDKMGMLARAEMTTRTSGKKNKYRKIKASWD